MALSSKPSLNLMDLLGTPKPNTTTNNAVANGNNYTPLDYRYYLKTTKKIPPTADQHDEILAQTILKASKAQANGDANNSNNSHKSLAADSKEPPAEGFHSTLVQLVETLRRDNFELSNENKQLKLLLSAHNVPFPASPLANSHRIPSSDSPVRITPIRISYEFLSKNNPTHSEPRNAEEAEMEQRINLFRSQLQHENNANNSNNTKNNNNNHSNQPSISQPIDKAAASGQLSSNFFDFSPIIKASEVNLFPKSTSNPPLLPNESFNFLSSSPFKEFHSIVSAHTASTELNTLAPRASSSVPLTANHFLNQSFLEKKLELAKATLAAAANKPNFDFHLTLQAIQAKKSSLSQPTRTEQLLKSFVAQQRGQNSAENHAGSGARSNNLSSSYSSSSGGSGGEVQTPLPGGVKLKGFHLNPVDESIQLPSYDSVEKKFSNSDNPNNYNYYKNNPTFSNNVGSQRGLLQELSPTEDLKLRLQQIADKVTNKKPATSTTKLSSMNTTSNLSKGLVPSKISNNYARSSSNYANKPSALIRPQSSLSKVSTLPSAQFNLKPKSRPSSAAASSQITSLHNLKPAFR
jgi:hypothetical protein